MSNGAGNGSVEEKILFLTSPLKTELGRTVDLRTCFRPAAGVHQKNCKLDGTTPAAVARPLWERTRDPASATVFSFPLALGLGLDRKS